MHLPVSQTQQIATLDLKHLNFKIDVVPNGDHQRALLMLERQASEGLGAISTSAKGMTTIHFGTTEHSKALQQAAGLFMSACC